MKKAKKLSLLIAAGALIMGGYLVNTKNNLQGGIVAKAEETEVDTKTPNKLSLTGKTADFYEGESFTLGSSAKITVTYSDKSTKTLTESDEGLSYTINDEKLNIGDKLVASKHNNGRVMIYYTEGETTIKLSRIYSLTVHSMIEEPENGSWQLVTSESQLVSGDKVVIASSKNKKAASYLKDGYILDTDITISDNSSSIEINNSTMILELYKSNDYWMFKDGDNDLLAAKQLKSLKWFEVSEVNTWQISIAASGDATISSTNSDYSYIQYNARYDRFNNYASSTNGASLPQIYKFVEDDSSDKFIQDWSTFRAKGGNEGICYYLKSENRAELDKMLARYDAFEDTSVIDTSEDITCVTIGETIAYLKGLIAKENEGNKATSNSSIVLNASLSSSTSLITIFAILGIASITGYYFIEKKKKASK